MRKFLTGFLIAAALLFSSVASAQFADQMVWGGTSGGSDNAQTLSVANLGGSVPIGVKFAGIAGFTNSGPMQLNIGGTSLINVYKLSSSGPVALSGGEVTTGNVFVVTYDGTQYQLLAQPPGAAPSIPVTVTNGRMTVTSASATATFTAAQIIAQTSGFTSYFSGSFSQAVNLATTGIGGMDTGSAPNNGYVTLYAAYNPTTTTWGIFATNATTSTAPIYAGANLPSGYTATAFLTTVPTNGSGQIKQLTVRDRDVAITRVTALSGGAATTSTSISLSSIIPGNAVQVWGDAIARTGNVITLSSDGNNTNLISISASSTSTTIQATYRIVVTTAQTIYYAVTGSTGDVNVTGYTL